MNLNNCPKISIVMGIYNCEKYLRESIESIIAQTYRNWELIMCDDGSHDNTYKIASEFLNKYPDKIVLLKNEKNMGLNYTLNKCIGYANGDFIARQDGDDISLPDRFMKEMKFLLDNPDYALVSCNMIFFDENGDWGRSHNNGEVKKENFIKGSPICHAPCIVRKKALLNVNCYSVSKKLLRVEDYHLWFKLYIAGYRLFSLDECLYKMRDDSDAYKRRNLKNRINETRLKLWGFKKIKIPFSKYIWAFKPIIAYLMPKKLYQKFHYKNLQNNESKKIKVAQFVGSMNCGGTETMLMNLYRKIDKNKFEFVFIENVKEKTWYTDEIIKLGGRIVKIEEFSFKNIKKYIDNMIKIFKTEDFDVVHSHVFLHSGIVMYAAQKAHIKKRFCHSHSAMRSKDNNFFKMHFLRHLILKYSTRLLACSTEAGVCLYGNKFLKKGLVLPNPIQLDKIKNINTQNVAKLTEKYKIDAQTLVVGHVGRLVEVKNHNFMIEIASILKKRNINFKMFFLGDGPLKKQIELKIKEKKLESNIIMTGNVSNVYEYMQIFNILLLPSFYEGLPVTLIEAQASGLPCIVSNNVSREADLGLNLINFCDIEDTQKWVELCIKSKQLEKIPDNIIYEKIIEKKLDVDTLKIEYENLYK